MSTVTAYSITIVITPTVTHNRHCKLSIHFRTDVESSPLMSPLKVSVTHQDPPHVVGVNL